MHLSSGYFVVPLFAVIFLVCILWATRSRTRSQQPHEGEF
jgi:hypothetical protein